MKWKQGEQRQDAVYKDLVQATVMVELPIVEQSFEDALFEMSKIVCAEQFV